MNNPRMFGLAASIVILSGCAYVHRSIDKLTSGFDDGPVVEAIDPTYLANAPQSPYAGSYPGNAFTIADVDFEFPIAIGEEGPIDPSITPQQPFACETEESNSGLLKQPNVDNSDGYGVAVYHVVDGVKTDLIAGHSQNCLVNTNAGYFYKPIDVDELKRWPDPPEIPDDVDTFNWNGTPTMFVVRIEQGTINRFIYTIAVLADPTEPLSEPTDKYWNKYLIYYFHGGISAGKRQGIYTFDVSLRDRMNDLRNRYAVVMSTGNATEHHYNMWVARNTAQMVKQQFVSLYGAPDKTIGVGESGGAIQQYLFAETVPDLLDAIIPVYSYPDVETQMNWMPDCELLEYYFDVTAKNNERWRDHGQRTMIEGLASDPNRWNHFYLVDDIFRILSFRWPHSIVGANECAMGWRLARTLIDDPRTTNRMYRYSDEVRQKTRFSHFHDLKDIYGVDEGSGPGANDGFAFRIFDNVGVQYGLKSLQRGEISVAEFLHLNANIGGWKLPKDQTETRYWVFQQDRRLREFSLWSEHNMTLAPGGPIPLSIFESGAPLSIDIAPRSTGNFESMRAAYLSGHVFRGKGMKLGTRILDVRHYNDPYLDIHHSFASLSTKLRLERDAPPDVEMRIWVSEFPNEPSTWFEAIDLKEEDDAEARGRLYRIVDEAVAAMRDWLDNGTDPLDACWTKEMALISSGNDVWEEDGACSTLFPHYESPRNAAGAPLEGDMFKCKLIAVGDAIGVGVYLPLDASAFQASLEAVFPDGVCDYRALDLARPASF